MSEMPAPEKNAWERTGQFRPQMTVSEALAFHPAAKWVLTAYHIGGCSHCSLSDEETLEQLAVAYDIPLERLLRDLNSLLTS